jgi:ATP-dependent DNA helicase PIF1
MSDRPQTKRKNCPFNGTQKKSPDKPIDVDEESPDAKTEKIQKIIERLEKEGKLTREQLYSVTIALEGHNQMICGPAGTGKSTLLRAIISVLIEQGYNVAFTATSGVAACQLGSGATTINSWMGVGLFSGTPESEALKIRDKLEAQTRWDEVDYLIWDEISMASPVMFDKFEWVARKVRGKNEPFGGIKIILSGDPYQLDPVKKKNSIEYKPEQYKSMRYFFETDSFKKYITKVVHLSTIFRQSSDPAYMALLNEVRYGTLSEMGKELLRTRIGVKLKCPDGVRPTVLLALRNDVDKINLRELASLPGKLYSYTKIERITKDMESQKGKDWLKMLNEQSNTDTVTELKLGAMVILTVNADLKGGLANGTQGLVNGFVEMEDPDFGKYMCPIVKFVGQSNVLPVPPWTWEKKKKRTSAIKKDEFSGVYIKQIPLRLAFALTIHKGIIFTPIIVTHSFISTGYDPSVY